MKESLEMQKKDCEAAILDLMKSGNEHLYIRGVLERLIEKIEQRLESL
jgi:hypothetical protein